MTNRLRSTTSCRGYVHETDFDGATHCCSPLSAEVAGDGRAELDVDSMDAVDELIWRGPPAPSVLMDFRQYMAEWDHYLAEEAEREWHHGEVQVRSSDHSSRAPRVEVKNMFLAKL